LTLSLLHVARMCKTYTIVDEEKKRAGPEEKKKGRVADKRGGFWDAGGPMEGMVPRAKVKGTRKKGEEDEDEKKRKKRPER